jgi:hypothetical protein
MLDIISHITYEIKKVNHTALLMYAYSGIFQSQSCLFTLTVGSTILRFPMKLQRLNGRYNE